MKRHIILFYLSFASTILFGQVTNNDSITNEPLNTADNVFSGNGVELPFQGMVKLITISHLEMTCFKTGRWMCTDLSPFLVISSPLKHSLLPIGS